MNLIAAEWSSVRRQKAFRVERHCDFVVHLLRADEIAKPCFEPRDVGVIAVTIHIAPDLVLADGASLPYDPDPDLAARRPLIEDYLLHDEPENLLPLDRTCRVPQLGKILAQREDLSAVRRGQRYRLLSTPTLVLNLNLLHLPELVLPDALQRPCHEAVLRLDGIVLPARPLRLVTRPLALERPLMLERTGLVLKFAESGNRQSETVRCQRFEQ